ncbi:MAG: ankyrin repeat domain-containing protein, partial [Chloroflexi bacterium]
MVQEGMLSQNIIDMFVGAAHGDFERVKGMLEEDPGLLNAQATWQEIAVEAAAQTGDEKIAHYLLERGAPLDIYTAASLGMEEEVRKFLEQEPELVRSVGVHNLPVLYFAAVGGRIKTAEILLERGADINAGTGGNTPLHGAAWLGHTEMVRWLLKHGA